MKIASIIFTLTLFTSTMFAQTKPTPIQYKAGKEQPVKVEVATPDIPDPIKNVITTKYNEWKLMSTHVYNDSAEYYELELKKGDEITLVKIDAKGNEL